MRFALLPLAQALIITQNSNLFDSLVIKLTIYSNHFMQNLWVLIKGSNDGKIVLSIMSEFIEHHTSTKMRVFIHPVHFLHFLFDC